MPAGTRNSRLPRTVWVLGLVSLLMDVSSEMVHGLLPVFLVGSLGASMAMVGLVEGVGEATASMTKLISGALSDRIGRRKPLVVLGYGLAALSKPIFALAPSAGWVLGARVADRIGKGLRGAPRDALIGDVTPAAIRGRAYGLRQTLDTVGAVIGPLLAVALMALLAGDMRTIFWIAAIPGGLAVALVVLGVREPPRRAPPRPEPQTPPAGGALPGAPLRRRLRLLGRAFWGVVGVGALLTFARFSEAFLILRAREAGLSDALTPLVLMTLSIVFALTAYPAGALSDRVGQRGVILAGFGVLVVTDLLLAAPIGLAGVFAGIGLWGLHLGLTQGLLATLVANVAPAELRGTAFGVFHFVSGLALLAGNLFAGALWASFGAAPTFLAGALVTSAGLMVLLRQARSVPDARSGGRSAAGRAGPARSGTLSSAPDKGQDDK